MGLISRVSSRTYRFLSIKYFIFCYSIMLSAIRMNPILSTRLSRTKNVRCLNSFQTKGMAPTEFVPNARKDEMFFNRNIPFLFVENRQVSHGERVLGHAMFVFSPLIFVAGQYLQDPIASAIGWKGFYGVFLSVPLWVINMKVAYHLMNAQ